jgi:hypothetical protein
MSNDALDEIRILASPADTLAQWSHEKESRDGVRELKASEATSAWSRGEDEPPVKAVVKAVMRADC